MATATQVGTNWDDTREVVKGGFAITPRPEMYPLELAAARAAVDASFETAETPKPVRAELSVTPELFGGAKEPVFPEALDMNRLAKLEQGVANLTRAGFTSM